MKKYRLQIMIVFLVIFPMIVYISPRLLSCEFSYPKVTLWMSIAVAEFIIFSKSDTRPETLQDWGAHLIGLAWIMFWTELVWDTYLMQRYYSQCGREERMLAACWLSVGLIIFGLTILLFSTSQYRKRLKAM